MERRKIYLSKNHTSKNIIFPIVFIYLFQISHIYAYEQDARQAITWLFELRDVMLREHGHVGCHEHEIQIQKTEYQAFQETAKVLRKRVFCACSISDR